MIYKGFKKHLNNSAAVEIQPGADRGFFVVECNKRLIIGDMVTIFGVALVDAEALDGFEPGFFDKYIEKQPDLLGAFTLKTLWGTLSWGGKFEAIDGNTIIELAPYEPHID